MVDCILTFLFFSSGRNMLDNKLLNTYVTHDTALACTICLLSTLALTWVAGSFYIFLAVHSLLCFYFFPQLFILRMLYLSFSVSLYFLNYLMRKFGKWEQLGNKIEAGCWCNYRNVTWCKFEHLLPHPVPDNAVNQEPWCTEYQLFSASEHLHLCLIM